jgi:hypothetical protein
MSKQIVAVAKQERRRLLSLLKPVEATIARFGGAVKRRRKSAGRKGKSKKATAATPIAKAVRPAKASAAKTKEQIKRELAKE